MLQLIQRDEFGQTNILASGKDVKELVEKARKIVQSENLENALVSSQQQGEWTMCWVDFVNEDGTVMDDVFYAGPKGVSAQKVLVDIDGSLEEHDVAEVDGEVRLYIGSFQFDRKVGPKPLYAKVLARTKSASGTFSPATEVEINTLAHQELQGKSILYIKKV